MPFKPNRKFKQKYNRLFIQDPMAANTFLLLCELADRRGQVETSAEEIAIMLSARFEDPEAYQI